jgi:hypothetical protein
VPLAPEDKEPAASSETDSLYTRAKTKLEEILDAEATPGGTAPSGTELAAPGTSTTGEPAHVPAAPAGPYSPTQAGDNTP